MKSLAVESVRSAPPQLLAAMMDVDVDTRGLWDAGELAQILRSHLSAPITPAEHEDAYGLADGRCLGELLCDPEAPEEQLQRLCRLAAVARQDPDAQMPPEVATLLYYAGAAAGIVRRGRRLEHLDDTALLGGFTWSAAQPWVDEQTRLLLKEAAAALAGPLTGAPDVKDPANLPAVGPAPAHVEALSGLSERAETFVAAPPPVPGYRLLKELSRGGQGVVYQGVRESTGRTVAVKILRDGPLAGRRDRERFLREVHILAGLRHPNVATVFDSGTTNDGWSYLVTDFIPGVPLDQYLAWAGAGTTDTGTVPASAGTAQRLQLFLKIGRAVQAAHQVGVVHRDLKPSNILVDEAGEPHVVDFGVARVVEVPQPSPQAPSAASGNVVTLIGQFVGSLPWSSPEQAEGRQGEVDARADVYSLGVILYQLLSGGRFPYDVTGPTWRALRNISSASPAPLRHTRPKPDGSARVPWPVERVVQKALSKRKDDRPATAGELVHDLEAAASGILPAGLVRLPRVPLAAMAAAVVLLSVLVAVTVRRHTVSSTPPDAARSAAPIHTETSPSAAAVPLGPVFTVNTSPVRNQVDVAAAMNDVGQAVIAWTGIGSGADDEVCAQLYRPDGGRVNTEFPTRGEKAFTHAKLHAPAVAMDPRGGFMIAVGVTGWNNGKGSGVYARRFNSEGEARSLSIIVASSTSEGITAPAVAGDGLGSFVIAWQSSGEDGTNPHVFARLYDTRGEPLTAQFAVGQTRRGHQSRPVVAMDAHSVLVAWESQPMGDGPVEVFCRRFDRTGAAIEDEWRAGSTFGETTTCPSVDINAEIGFVIAWVAKNSAGGRRIMARQFNAEGVAKGAADVIVADAVPNEELWPRAALEPDGSWNVFWLGHSPVPALMCRRFASDDAPFAQSAEVLTVLPRPQCPAIVAASGSVLGAWSMPPDGGVAPAAVVARRWRMSALPPAPVGPMAPTSIPSAVPAIVSLGPVRQYGPFHSDVTSRFTALAADASGRHVLAWEADRDGDAGRRIDAQRFDAQGAELGPAFKVSSDRHPAWWRPTVAIDVDGSFVIAYGGGRSPAGSGGMYVRRFAAGGSAPPEEEFELAPVSDGRQSYPSTVMCDGSYLITWHRDLPKRGEARVMGRGFHGPSRQWGQEFYVSDSSDPGWTFPSTCGDRYSYFTAAWAKTEFGGERVRVRRFDPDADPVGEEFFLSRSVSIKETVPSAASDGRGNVLIVWRDAQHPSEYRIRCRRVDHTGALGEELTLNRHALWHTSAASVAMNPAGQAVAVWVHQELEGGRQTLVARRFDPTGGVIDEDEQELETLAGGTLSYPCVAMDARGVFVVSWQIDHGPSQGTSVYVRRYGSESIVPG